MSLVFSNLHTFRSIFSRVLGAVTGSPMAHLAREIRAFAAYVRKDYKAARAQYPFLEW